MSEKFSQTRKHFWRGLESMRDYARPGYEILDFGCGNGRLLELIGDVPDIDYRGVDISQRLVDIAEQRYQRPNVSFQKIDPGQDTLPFADDFFNTAYGIAVFHHFPSKEYRFAAARELHRVVKKDGRVVITVWNLWQKKYLGNIVRNWLDKIICRSELDWNDCLISFADNDGKKFQRYHRAFTRKELKNLFSEAGFSVEKCEIVGGRNIVLVGRKIR